MEYVAKNMEEMKFTCQEIANFYNIDNLANEIDVWETQNLDVYLMCIKEKVDCLNSKINERK